MLVVFWVPSGGGTQYGCWVWSITILAAFSHAIQASAMEYYRHEYDYWVYAKAASYNPSIEEIRSRPQARAAHRYLHSVYPWYLKMQQLFVGIDSDLRDRLKLLLSSTTIDHPEVRAIYRHYNLSMVRKWTFLSTNYRSAILLLACLVGSPLYYFIAEFTLWNLLLLWVRGRQISINNKLKKELDSFAV